MIPIVKIKSIFFSFSYYHYFVLAFLIFFPFFLTTFFNKAKDFISDINQLLYSKHIFQIFYYIRENVLRYFRNLNHLTFAENWSRLLTFSFLLVGFGKLLNKLTVLPSNPLCFLSFHMLVKSFFFRRRGHLKLSFTQTFSSNSYTFW